MGLTIESIPDPSPLFSLSPLSFLTPSLTLHLSRLSLPHFFSCSPTFPFSRKLIPIYIQTFFQISSQNILPKFQLLNSNLSIFISWRHPSRHSSSSSSSSPAWAGALQMDSTAVVLTLTWPSQRNSLHLSPVMNFLFLGYHILLVLDLFPHFAEALFS